jgi:hypothetical protein
MKNRIILVFLFSALVSGTYGIAQDLTTTSITLALGKAIVNYQQNFPEEEIYLHLDRSLYLSGENVWFTAYARNAVDNTLPAISGVIYADIVNQKTKIVASAKIKLKENRASGNFYLPDSLSTGTYQIRAYSNWMKNFSASQIFITKILVVNRFTENIVPAEKTPENFPVACYFYPEGGFASNEKTTHIAFKLTGANKKGVNMEGLIVDESGAKITELHSLHSGIGSFELKAQPGKSYIAFFKSKETEYRFPLNLPMSDYSIKAKNESGKFHIEISYSGNNKLKENARLSILLIPRASKPFTQELKLHDGKLFATIPVTYSEGVMQIYVLDEEEMVLYDRILYIHSNSLPRLSCKTNKSIYGNREKVQLIISNGDSTTMPVFGSVSVTVSDFPNRRVQESGGQEVCSYLMLQSGISEEIEDPSWYFENEVSSREEALDNLLITLTGKKLKWSTIFSKIPRQLKYCAERSGMILSGQVRDNISQKGTAGVGILLSSPDTIPNVKYAITDNDGGFRFLLDNYFGLNDLIIQTDDILPSENLSLVLNDNLLPAEVIKDNSLIDIDSAFSRYIIKAIKRSRINKTYQINPVAEKSNPEMANTLKAYGYPDKVIYPEEYIKLPGFEEIILEIVPGVIMKKRKDNYYFQIANPEMTTINNKSTLLVDGVPIQNPAGMLKWDSDKIKKIEVCYSPRIYGDWILGGVLSVFTVKDGCPLDLTGILYRNKWEGFLKEKYFQSPNYKSEESKSSSRPDFRGLLYWNPEVQIGVTGSQTVEFYTSDESGTYYINLEGITSNGIPVRASIPLIVEKGGKKDHR